MSKMEYVKFSKFIISTQYGYTAKETSLVKGDAKYLRITDIVPYFVNKEQVPFCKIDDNKKKNYLINKNDLLIARTGATTGYNLVVDESYKNFVFASYLIRFNYNKNDLYPLYLKYVLKSQQWCGFVNNFISGSAQPGMNAKVFGKFQIPIFNYDIQKRISNILSTYDKLIENNNKRIKLLEQMAEKLYKEWFVRFRFPGHEDVNFVDSSLGKIPSMFEIDKMGNVIEYYIGGGWGEEELSEQFSQEAYVVRGTDFPNVKYGILDSCPLRYHKSSNYSKREFKVNDIAFEVSGGTQEQPVGRSVLITKRQLNRFNNRLICASFCKLIRCNVEKISPRYFYHWLQYLYETKIIEQYQLQSTGIINFQFEYFLRKGNVLIPPKDLMEEFTELVEPIYDEIDILAEQNSKLIKQRDLLLPRLMSGKLEV